MLNPSCVHRQAHSVQRPPGFYVLRFTFYDVCFEETMTIQEKIYFLRQLQTSFTSIGALIPTSRYAARMMASECARRAGPRIILEVGPGTGAITAEIVRIMRPGDRLTLVELNEGF